LESRRQEAIEELQRSIAEQHQRLKEQEGRLQEVLESRSSALLQGGQAPDEERRIQESVEELRQMAEEHGAQLDRLSGLVSGSPARAKALGPGTGGSEQEAAPPGRGGLEEMWRLLAEHGAQLEAVTKLLWGAPPAPKAALT